MLIHCCGKFHKVLSVTNLLFLAANGEIHDLRIILNSSDKELREYKEKLKARETELLGLESKVCKIWRSF